MSYTHLQIYYTFAFSTIACTYIAEEGHREMALLKHVSALE